jgi:dTMP kinase
VEEIMKMQKHLGLFITVEGVEGAGKSTVMQFMKNYLQERNIQCLTTREFGGTEIAEAIRKVLLEYHYQETMCQETEILLAFASRAQHLANLILPNLQKGTWVLCDRFTDSTYAYQGFGRGAAYERIKIIEDWVQRGLKPDYTFLLDLDAATGLARLKKRSAGLDRIESEEVQFFQRVRNGYLKMAAQEPHRYRVINAVLKPEEVLAQLEQHLAQIVSPL